MRRLWLRTQLNTTNILQMASHLDLLLMRHGVDDDSFTGGTSGQYFSELYTTSRLNLASQQDNIAGALVARSEAKTQVSRGDGRSAWRPSPGSGAEWDIIQLNSMILIVKGGAAWRHTELIDGSHSEMARTSAYGELVNSVVLCKRQYEQRGTCGIGDHTYFHLFCMLFVFCSVSPWYNPGMYRKSS
jgi:hypothetical protein